MTLLPKFQKLFDKIGSDDTIQTTLNSHEVGRILAMIEAFEAYEKSLGRNLEQTFEKFEREQEAKK